jgi:hypothetical protein
VSATVITITEDAVFVALWTVLNGFNLRSSTPGAAVPVVRGLANRVPEPASPDFLVMWPLRRDRLATNIDTYTDAQIIGSIAGNVLGVTEIVLGSVAAGQTIYGAGVSNGCVIQRQITGPAGGLGTYAVSPTAGVSSGPLYVGIVSALQPIDFVTQVDVHGPCSGDNAQIISTLIRDYVGVAAFAAVNPGVVPLYTDDPRQTAFNNAEEQVEERWTVDVHLEVDTAVVFTQQFAAQLEATLTPADLTGA